MRILYVEDEPNDAALVELYIRTTPHELILAVSREEAWQVLNTEVPDLILTDVMLGPSRDGYTLASELREAGYVGGLVALTGLSTRRDMEDCQRAGFNQVLVKPYTIQQLAEVLNQFG
jgi:two-component system capsular synthesis sensor histidine kinase RcsC